MYFWLVSEPLTIGIIAAVATIVAAIFVSPRVFKDARSNVLKDLQIYSALPDSSSAKRPLLKRIEGQLETLEQHGDARRRPLGIVLGLVLMGLAAYGGWYILTVGGWWHIGWAAVTFVFILGAAGFAQDVRKSFRDSKGNPVK